MKHTIIVLSIWSLILFGWARNVYKLIQCDFEAPYKTEVIRGVCVFVFPLGAIIGYISIGEE